MDLITPRRWSWNSITATSPTGEHSCGTMAPFDRPGKFAYSWDFLEADENDKSLLEVLKKKKLGHINAQPGFIVHIADKGDASSSAESPRLDQRVMLVLFRSDMSFMCLGFCFHEHQQSAQDQWRVCDKGKGEEAAEGNRLEALEVHLRPHGLPDSCQGFAPKKNITVNIQDIWNVGNEVYVRVLGVVAPNALRGLVKAVAQRFVQNLNTAVFPADETDERVHIRIRTSSDIQRPSNLEA